MCKKDSPIEELSRKVSAIENILYVKDDQIKPLMEKVKVVEKKARKLWTSKTWSLWIWTNLYKSFRYLHWLWSRTNFWGDLEQHVNNLHKLHNWQYCSFTSKSGLKAHTSKYNITHSYLDNNAFFGEVNWEIYIHWVKLECCYSCFITSAAIKFNKIKN